MGTRSPPLGPVEADGCEDSEQPLTVRAAAKTVDIAKRFMFITSSWCDCQELRVCCTRKKRALMAGMTVDIEASAATGAAKIRGVEKRLRTSATMSTAFYSLQGCIRRRLPPPPARQG